MNQPQAIACTLPIEELNKRRKFELNDLFEGALKSSELEVGYELTFPSDKNWFGKLTSFIATERECCSFLHFELIILPNHAPLKLRILGSAEVKEFISGFMLQPANSYTEG